MLLLRTDRHGRPGPVTPEVAVAGAGRRASGGADGAGEGTTWWRLGVASVARVLLLSWACLLLWAVVPLLLGWTSTTVMSGSMEPRIQVGDVVASSPTTAENARPGQVLLVDDPDHEGRLRLHRLVRTDPDGGLVLRGDANAAADSTPVRPEAVHALGRLRIPVVGTPVVWFHERRWGRLVLLTLGAVAAAAATRLDRGDREGPGGSGRAGTALLAAGALAVVPAMTDAGFAGQTGSLAQLSAAAYFRCGPAVMAGNPSLFYRFDETSGTVAKDSSGNNRNGTYKGGLLGLTGITLGLKPAACSDGNTAAGLTGASLLTSSGSVSGPDVPYASVNTFTIEIWFRTTTPGGRLIGFSAKSGLLGWHSDRHLYLSDGGRVVFGVYPDATMRTIISPARYDDGKWHLATASLSPSGALRGMRLYVDGSLVASNSAVTAAEVPSDTTTGHWQIGADHLDNWTPASSHGWFAGSVDDAAVYPTALSPAMVENHWSAR